MSTTTARRPTTERGRAAQARRRTRARDAAAAASSGLAWLKARTTSQRCPHCEQRTWVPRTEWAQHSRMHALANARAGKARRQERQRAAEQAARPEGRNRQRTRGKGPGPRPSTVRYVDDDGNPIDWTPGDPLPPNTGGRDPWTPFDGEAERERVRNLHRENRRRNSRIRRGGRWLRGKAGDYWRWQFPQPQTPTGPSRPGAGSRWKARTHNPGGNPVGTRPPAPSRPTGPPIAPVIPITPTTPVAGPTTPVAPTGTTGGGPVAPTGTRPGPRTKTPGGGGGGGGGAGASLGEISSAAQRWAQSPPETLSQTKQDADNMGEALSGLADAFVQRQNVETDRMISASCVEPYQEAANLIRQAQAKVEEVHSRLNQRYGEVADELAKPDTPDPDYLKEGRG